MKGYKVVREDHIHHGFKYQEGLNVDPNPFQPEGTCVEGGLYFFTDIKDVYKWLDYGVYLYQVEVPTGKRYVQDPCKDKYRAEALYLTKPLDLRERATWGYLTTLDPYSIKKAIGWAVRIDNVKMLEYFLTVYPY